MKRLTLLAVFVVTIGISFFAIHLVDKHKKELMYEQQTHQEFVEFLNLGVADQEYMDLIASVYGSRKVQEWAENYFSDVISIEDEILLLNNEYSYEIYSDVCRQHGVEPSIFGFGLLLKTRSFSRI